MKKFNYLITTIFIVLASNAAQASIGDAASNLSGGAELMTKVMWAACVAVGIVLFSVSFAQFQEHRRNPKLVPLANPITYLFLALFCLAIPFIGYLLKADTSYQAVQSGEAQYGGRQTGGFYRDVDAPYE